MTIAARIVADSITPEGDRLTTFVLTYPRFIHSEFMTHRAISRNAASSRAIPVAKMMKRTWANPAIPIVWGRNQSGMQAGSEVSPARQKLGRFLWMSACAAAIGFAWLLDKLGLHKQIVNRVYEMFTHIEVVASATDWDNLLGLRAHPMAEPHFQVLAGEILKALNESQPKKLAVGEWHLPFVAENEPGNIMELLKASVARCARVSYLLHDGTQGSLEKDIALHDKLVVEQPVHASPAEHQGQAALKGTRSGNFSGFIQYRKTLPNETMTQDPRLRRLP